MTYECYVTLAATSADRMLAAKILAEQHAFEIHWPGHRDRRAAPTATHSVDDSFMVGTGADQRELTGRMGALIKALQASGVPVYRYKIEQVILDSRRCDLLELL